MDTWPAHALGPSTPDLNPGQAKQTNEFMPKGVHKPKFLEQLEAFLQKELRSLDCAEMVPSEKRLQVCLDCCTDPRRNLYYDNSIHTDHRKPRRL